MAEEKKRRKKKAYLNDFEKEKSGEYIYKGNTYVWEEREEQQKKRRRLLLICACLTQLFLIAAGCVTAPGTGNCIYVLIPYVVSLISGVTVLWGVVRLIGSGSVLREYVHKATAGQIPGRAVIAAAGSAVTVMGELLYVILNGAEEKLSGFLIYLFLMTSSGVLSVLIWKNVTKIPWKRNAGNEKSNKKQY